MGGVEGLLYERELLRPDPPLDLKQVSVHPRLVLEHNQSVNILSLHFKFVLGKKKSSGILQASILYFISEFTFS